MFTRVHKAHQVAGGDNKGSSGALMDYLDKENKDKEKDEKEGFFNDEKDDISKIKARNIIDSNNVRLGEKDTKLQKLTSLLDGKIQNPFNPNNKKAIIPIITNPPIKTYVIVACL